MARSGKNQNDLRGIRKETAAVFLISSVVFMAAYCLGTVLGSFDSIIFGAFILAVHAAVCAVAYYFLERRRKHNTAGETLAPVMGRIMFDAVVKMNTPVFICDAEERIIWYNNAMDDLTADTNKLYGETVESLFGITVEDIRRDRHEQGAKISCEGRSFYAKFNHIKTDDNDFALITTVETTEIDMLNSRIEEDETVVSYIMIDNLGEMLQYDSEEYRPAAAKIDDILRDWAGGYNSILKEYDRDKYIFITQMRVLDDLVLRKFDILDRVRAVRSGDTNLPLTISLGMSAIHGTYEAKERAAHAALDMALQRGGDQAVVKGDGSIDFYGGITKSVQKRTNVRARVVSNELMAAIKSASNVLVMGHKNADFDSIGACVGLARIAMYCGARVNIVVNTADRNISPCRTLLEAEADYIGLFVSGEAALDMLETGTLVIVADVNNLAITEEPELVARTDKLAVIDHHRKMSEFDREPDVEYIEPSVSAACEIVAEMLEQVLPRDALSRAEAEVMLAGITLDTKQFSKNTGTRTFSAAMYLRDCGADPSSVQELFRQSFDDYMREARFRRNVEIYRGAYAITVVENSDGGDRVIAAKAADNLLTVDGIKASFAAINLGDTVHLSARSAGEVNVQLILEEMGGGGRYDAAGAQCTGTSIDDVVTKLKEAIDKHI